MNKRQQETIKVLLVLIMFFINIIGSVAFVHTHEIDGVKVVHSHPFAGKNHNHSANQIISLHFITATLGDITNATNIAKTAQQLLSIICEHDTISCITFASDLHTLRAPPYC